jgi:hypothetical protein
MGSTGAVAAAWQTATGSRRHREQRQSVLLGDKEKEEYRPDLLQQPPVTEGQGSIVPSGRMWAEDWGGWEETKKGKRAIAKSVNFYICIDDRCITIIPDYQKYIRGPFYYGERYK